MCVRSRLTHSSPQHCPSLRRVDAWQCGLGDAPCVLLALCALRSRSVHTLSLGRNLFSGTGANRIRDLLKADARMRRPPQPGARASAAVSEDDVVVRINVTLN